MTSTRIKLLLAGLGVGVVAAILFSTLARRGGAASPGPRACAFARGRALSYAFAVKTRSVVRFGAAPMETSIHLTGNLELLGQGRRSATSWLVRGRVHEVDLELAGSGQAPAGGQAPQLFELEVDDRCRFIGIAFPRGAAPESENFVKRLLLGFEISYPAAAPARARQWIARHHDQYGEYTAAYALESDARLSKRKLTYSRTADPAAPAGRPAILSSSGRIELDPETFWVKKLRLEEAIATLGRGGREEAQTIQLATLERVGGAVSAELEAASLQGASFGGLATVSQAPEKRTAAAQGKLMGFGVESALAELARLSHTGAPGQALTSMVLFFTEYLQDNPGRARELLERLKRGELDQGLHAVFFFALARSDTPEARRVLIDALGDHALHPNNRMQAAIALQDLPSANLEVYGALRGQAALLHTAPDQDSQQVAKTSLFSLGALARSSLAKDAALGNRVFEDFSKELDGARSAAERQPLLEAIGNTGDPRFADRIVRHLDDESEAVRRSAANATRFLDSQPVRSALLHRLGKDPSSDVREKVVEALTTQAANRRASPDAAVVAAAAAQLESEPSPMVRRLLIRLLGAAAEGDAAARTALIQHFSRERVPELQAELGKYLKADELR